MGRASNKKKGRAKRASENIFSRLEQHKKVGTKLTPPLMTLPGVNFTSWRDHHAPEMLWAFLVAEVFGRDEYLGCFRAIASWSKANLHSEPTSEVIEAAPAVEVAFQQPDVIPDHTRLASIPVHKLREFVAIITRHPLGYGALRPLLLFENLPGRAAWKEVIGVEPQDSDAETVIRASIAMLDHQSEKSTDVRWLKVVSFLITGTLRYGENVADTMENIYRFPSRGDMRQVRPSIRSQEMMIRRNPPSPWPEQFWDEGFKKTQCIDPTSSDDYQASSAARLEIGRIMDIRIAVADAFHDRTQTTSVDARLEGSIGFALYALSLLHELKFGRTDGLASGRLILRSLAELLITLKYLVTKNDLSLWKSWRVYGNGQAKLAFLQSQRHADDLPKFVDQNTLEALSNEDTWIEFQDIDVGHWNKSNLRSMAESAGVKDIWEKYYQWPSAFAHGHWCATRDLNFITCHNPLHRLHRIPRLVHRSSPSVLEDAVRMVNSILEEFANMHGLTAEQLPHVTLLAETDHASHADQSSSASATRE